ncbi:putative LRR receptor-like serine/threonine-protein kinase [Cocos nucifera]|uniref:Putative LRR receptor-like serine/threonine-protein kinase n=1 Tax=Cocos nucifera TaxID=13894 RepID=A0A8K0IIK8_COCNU|nr:putative LRR receptor-like serine/threonine-protein kinase [Cocos nucifera]
MSTRKSKISVAMTAAATSSLWRVLLLPWRVTIHALCVSSSMKSSHALENTIGASPDIIFTSSPDLFMIFFILASGSEWGPVLPDTPPERIPEYVPACLMPIYRCVCVCVCVLERERERWRDIPLDLVFSRGEDQKKRSGTKKWIGSSISVRDRFGFKDRFINQYPWQLTTYSALQHMWVFSFYRLLLSNFRPFFPLIIFLNSRALLPSLNKSYGLVLRVSALAAFKRAVFEDPLSVLSDWNTLDGDPCNWTGVICSKTQNHVLSLNLSSSSLKGFLVPELGSLSSLQELILRNNLFVGTIPKQIGMLKSLTVLDLSLNRLTGSIPPELGDLTGITKINLQSNGLTGNIPAELGKLKNLSELWLGRNRLKGPIPGSSNSSFSYGMFSSHNSHNNVSGLCQSSQLKAGDFSYNFFVGQIPPCLKYLPRSSFQGNCFQDSYSVLQRSSQLCGGGSVKSQGIARETSKQNHEGNKHQNLQQQVWLLILEITTGVLVVVFLIAGAMTAVKSKLKTPVKIPWKRTMTLKDEITISIDSEMLKNVPRLTRQELEVACEDFSNIIGSSPDSIVYKGTMKDGPEIAVISLCISKDRWTGYLEFFFQSKVANLARLNHETTAKLLGYCKESDPFSRMLVFEYASNGTLYQHLHYGDGCQLSWLRRMKIAIGVARGLKYLHTELQPPFTISELNSSAVYLTEDFSPKLVDFEIWKMIFSKSGKNSGYITNEGSFHGYADSLEQLSMDVQGNTYAFGVLLLELISGRPQYCKDRGCLVDWALKYLQNPEEISKLIDPELKNVRSDDIAVICSVVSLCIEPDPSKRPSMQIITAMLENGVDLSAAALLKESPLAWAELALSS